MMPARDMHGEAHRAISPQGRVMRRASKAGPAPVRAKAGNS